MKKRLKNIPKNKFGATDAVGGLNGAGSIVQIGMQAAQNSKENGVTAANTIGSTLGGMASGASAGMAIGGPWGAAIGAVVGGVSGLVPSLMGRKGSVDPITGEVTEGSGIKGRRGPSKAELYERSQNIRENNAYRDYNTTAAYDWYQENGANDYTLAANGGVIPNALAYVDDGELLRTPNGEIINIPEQGKPTDSNLVSVPEGTQVLSDTLKVPGTKETFAEVGRKLMKKQKYGNDVYAQNSRMLNEMHNQKAYDELLTIQEDMKKKKGIKKSIGKYDTGTPRIRNVQSTADYNTDIYGTDPYWTAWSGINLQNYQQANDLQRRYHRLGLYNPADMIPYNAEVQDYQNQFNNMFNSINQQIGHLRTLGRIIGRGGTQDTPTTWTDGYAGSQTALRTLGRNVNANQLTNINARLFARGLEAYNDPETGMVLVKPIDRSDVSTRDLAELSTTEPKTRSLADLASTNNQSITETSPIPTTDTNSSKSRSFNVSGAISDLSPLISGLSSFIANHQNAKDLNPEPVYPRYARAYFSPVEYNIQPQLDAINRTNAIARYNETQLAPRTGANLAFGIQSAVARNRAINEAYNNQRAINNQTRARNAQVATATSQFNAQAQHTADVEYAQNRAQARNLRRQYRSANAAIIPSMLRDIRQNRRDQALLEYMRPFLEYGSTSEAFANLKRGMR